MSPYKSIHFIFRGVPVTFNFAVHFVVGIACNICLGSWRDVSIRYRVWMLYTRHMIGPNHNWLWQILSHRRELPSCISDFWISHRNLRKSIRRRPPLNRFWLEKNQAALGVTTKKVSLRRQFARRLCKSPIECKNLAFILPVGTRLSLFIYVLFQDCCGCTFVKKEWMLHPSIFFHDTSIT